MKDLLDSISEFCQDVKGAMEKAIDDFGKVLPSQVITQIKSINVLNSADGRSMSQTSLNKYLSSINVELSSSGNVIIELDPNDWLSNANEDGVKPWNMMDTHLKSGYKMSKKGYRYKVIPLNVDKNSSKKPKTGSFDDKGDWNQGRGDNSQRMRKKIDSALKNPKWNSVRTSILPMTGQVKKLSRLDTADGELSGLYKMEKFADAGSMVIGKKPESSKMVLMRTMTDDPTKGIGKWEHPGIIAKEIFPKLEAWLATTGDALLEDLIENELGKIIDLDGE